MFSKQISHTLQILHKPGLRGLQHLLSVLQQCSAEYCSEV